MRPQTGFGRFFSRSRERAAAFGAWLSAQLDARTVLLLAGLILLAAGFAQVWLPLAYIAPGGVLVGCALWPSVIEFVEACSVPPERKARR